MSEVKNEDAKAQAMAEAYRLAGIYKTALDEKDRLKDETDENNAFLANTMDALVNAMIAAEVTDLLCDGLVYSLGYRNEYSKKGGVDEEEFFRALEEHQLGGIIKRTVDSRTLNKTMREIATLNADALKREVAESSGDDILDIDDEVLPEDLAEFVNVWGHWSIAKPKKPTASKQKIMEKAQKAKRGE